jgi:hypothetical protein
VHRGHPTLRDRHMPERTVNPIERERFHRRHNSPHRRRVQRDASGPHAFDLMNDSEASREVIRAMLAFLRANLGA